LYSLELDQLITVSK